MPQTFGSNGGESCSWFVLSPPHPLSRCWPLVSRTVATAFMGDSGAAIHVVPSVEFSYNRRQPRPWEEHLLS